MSSPAPTSGPSTPVKVAAGVAVAALAVGAIVVGIFQGNATAPCNPTVTAQPQNIFLETFDGSYSAPQACLPNGWDVVTTGFDTAEVGTPAIPTNAVGAMAAQHGPSCEGPGFPYTATNSHQLTRVQDTVFVCGGHMMTAPGLSGYGAVYLVPPTMMDFSKGTSVFTWDQSTLATSSRDWTYITLAPFDGHNKFAYNQNDQAVPPNSIKLLLNPSESMITTQRVNGVDSGPIGNTFYDIPMFEAANGVRPSASRRDTFRVELSATHIKVCLTGNNIPQTYTFNGDRGNGVPCWTDDNLPTPLNPTIWKGNATILISHVSYNPEKGCSAVDDATGIVHNMIGDANCPPNTWHWDSFAVAPAANFTILNPTDRYASFNDPNAANTVTFSTPSPANAHLSFLGYGDCTSQKISFDNGSSWVSAVPQPATTQCQHGENGGEYWTAIPQGITTVKFTGTRIFGVWGVQDAAVWSTVVPTSTSAPSTTPLQTLIPPFTSSPVPTTPIPTSIPSASSTPLPTQSTSPSPSQTSPPTPTLTCEVQVRVNGVVEWITEPPTFCNGAHP